MPLCELKDKQPFHGFNQEWAAQGKTAHRTAQPDAICRCLSAQQGWTISVDGLEAATDEPMLANEYIGKKMKKNRLIHILHAICNA